MRAVVMGLICAVSLLTDGVPAPAQSDSSKAIEQCIRENAPAVEQAVPSLTDAVDFLVSDLCAKPIAEQQERERRESITALQALTKKQCTSRTTTSQAEVKSEDDPCALTGVDALDLTGGSYTLYAPGYNKPAEPTALAAKILLDLRISRMNATHTQGTH